MLSLTILITTIIILPIVFSRTIEIKNESFPICVIYGEDRRPLFISIRVKPQFKSLQDVRTYIEVRKDVLNRSVGRGSEPIEAQISFVNATIEQLKEIVIQYDLRATTVQGFAIDMQGNYLYAFGRDLSAENKEVNIDEFISWAKTFRPAHRALEVSQFRIDVIRGTLSGNKAHSLQDDSRVLLVDSTSDLVQLFAGQASSIRVESMPQPAPYIELFEKG